MLIPEEVRLAAARIKILMNDPDVAKAYPNANPVWGWFQEYKKDYKLVLKWAVEQATSWTNQIEGGP